MKQTSKAVKASRERSGVKPTSFAFTAEEKAEIDDWATACGLSRKEALLEAVRKAKEQGRITKAQIIAEIERRLR